MQGRKSQNGVLFQPVIITYKDDDVSHVLEAFSKLIVKHKLSERDNTIFKAVGMVKDKNEGLSIKLFPEFEKLRLEVR